MDCLNWFLLSFGVGVISSVFLYLLFFNRGQTLHHEYGHALAAKKYTDRVMVLFPFTVGKMYEEKWKNSVTICSLKSMKNFKAILNHKGAAALTIFEAKDGSVLSPEQSLEVTRGGVMLGRRYLLVSLCILLIPTTCIEMLVYDLLEWFAIAFLIRLLLAFTASVIAMILIFVVLAMWTEGIPSKKEMEEFKKGIEACEKGGIFKCNLSDGTILKYADDFKWCIVMIREKGLHGSNQINVVKEKIEELQKKSDS